MVLPQHCGVTFSLTISCLGNAGQLKESISVSVGAVTGCAVIVEKGQDRRAQ